MTLVSCPVDCVYTHSGYNHIYTQVLSREISRLSILGSLKVSNVIVIVLLHIIFVHVFEGSLASVFKQDE